MSDLGVIVRHALLDELAFGREIDPDIRTPRTPCVLNGIARPVERMLRWLIEYDPVRAGRVIGEVIGEAERRFKIRVLSPSTRCAWPLRPARWMDEGQPGGDFLDRVNDPGDPCPAPQKPHLIMNRASRSCGVWPQASLAVPLALARGSVRPSWPCIVWPSLSSSRAAVLEIPR